MTIKELKALSGKQFKRVIPLNNPCIEDMDKMRQELIQAAQENNISFKEKEDTFVLDGNRVFMKPKRNRESIGIIEFRSKDYIFHDPINGKCYGDLPESKDINDNGFNLIGYEGEFLLSYELI
jgi:hypothetical protein